MQRALLPRKSCQGDEDGASKEGEEPCWQTPSPQRAAAALRAALGQGQRAGCLLRPVPPQRRRMLRERHPPCSPQGEGGLQAEVIPKQPPHTRPGRRGCSCKSSS